jgi:3D (Asp-Asp-Asp) domain-containing protein
MKRGIFISGALFCLIGASYLKSPNPVYKDTRTGHIFEPQEYDFSPKIIVHATAYCACPICCGKYASVNGGGWTAKGTRAIEGFTIAADKRIFPFGTCLDMPEIGKRIVEDTGSAIKLFRIDVYFSDHQNAVVFGFQRNLLASFCDEEL